MSTEVTEIKDVTEDDIIDSLKAGSELYTNITEAFVKEFVF